MKVGIYCIKDARSGWLTPTVENNDSVAYRNFAHAVLNAGTVLTSHKKDFRLYLIGYFDTDSGAIDSIVPSLIADGGDIE